MLEICIIPVHQAPLEPLCIGIDRKSGKELDTNKRCDVRAIETTSKMFEAHPYLETRRVEDLLWTANVSSRYGDSPNWS